MLFGPPKTHCPPLLIQMPYMTPPGPWVTTPLQAVGTTGRLTQAATVKLCAVVKFRSAALGEVTDWEIPLQLTALPIFPALQVAPFRVPVWPLPAASEAVVPVPSSKVQ